MIFGKPNRALTLVASAVVLIQTGCSGYKSLSREDLTNPEAAQSYIVTTVDGVEHTFISLHLEGESLLGTERVTMRSTVGEGLTARETISNRYEEKSIPWSEVSGVRAEAPQSSGGLWWAAASIMGGAAVFLLLATQGTDEPPDGNTGKEDPGGPGN